MEQINCMSFRQVFRHHVYSDRSESTVQVAEYVAFNYWRFMDALPVEIYTSHRAQLANSRSSRIGENPAHQFVGALALAESR